MEAILRPPSKLKVNDQLPNNWKKFKNSFNNFMVASGKDGVNKKIKAAIFLNFIGEEGQDIIESFNLTEEQMSDDTALINAFEDYVKPRKNVIYERFLFYNRHQKEGESFENFLTSISKMVKTCEFNNEQEALRDRIVLGTNRPEVQERLLRMTNLDFDKAVKVCRASEVSKTQVETMIKQETHALEVRKYSPHTNKVPSVKSDVYKCKKCGTLHKKFKCPAFGKICSKCKGKNHYAVGCQIKKVKEISVESTKVTETSESESDTFDIDNVEISIDSLNETECNTMESWSENIKIINENVKFKLDTGADVNLVQSA